jgi:hypothetical protein
MKKIYSMLLAACIATGASTQPIVGGDIRVILESITCVNKSWDGFVEFDGPGSEVFMNCGVVTRNPNSPYLRLFKQTYTGRSYGNTLPSAPTGRIKAGTASQQGGIDNGNSFTVNEQLFAVHLDPDGVFYFSPSLWEWDNPNETIRNRFNTQLLADLESISLMRTPSGFVTDADATDPNGNLTMLLANAYGLTIPPNSYPGILKPLINIQDNRPMGISAYEGAPLQFDPKIIVINAANANAIFNLTTPLTSQQPSSFKQIRKYTMRFAENTYGISTSNGEYIAVFRIEFAPAYPDNPALPEPGFIKKVPVTNSTIDRPINRSIGQPVNTTMKNLFIGTWSGTRTNETGLYPEAISFQLTSNNELLMIHAPTGTVVVRGTYTTSGTSISGSMKYLSSGDIYSFTGSFDSNTQKMNCTLGSGQGKWEVTKK